MYTATILNHPNSEAPGRLEITAFTEEECREGIARELLKFHETLAPQASEPKPIESGFVAIIEFQGAL